MPYPPISHELKVKTTTHPMREPAVVKPQHRPQKNDPRPSTSEAITDHRPSTTEKPTSDFRLPTSDSDFCCRRSEVGGRSSAVGSRKSEVAPRPVRGDFKREPTLSEALRASSSNSARALLGAQNEVVRYRQLRNEVSRAHDLIVGSSVQARVATRNNKLRVVLRGETGTVDTIYRSGRIHVNWSNGGSGWYTITDLSCRQSAVGQKEQPAIGNQLSAIGQKEKHLLPKADSR